MLAPSGAWGRGDLGWQIRTGGARRSREHSRRRQCPGARRGGERAPLLGDPGRAWTLGLKVPSRRLSTHVHGCPHMSTGDTPIPAPRIQGRPPTSTGLAVNWLSSEPPRPGDRPRWRPRSPRGIRIWKRRTLVGAPEEVPLRLPLAPARATEHPSSCRYRRRRRIRPPIHTSGSTTRAASKPWPQPSTAVMPSQLPMSVPSSVPSRRRGSHPSD
jgi:hypothetical protein